MLLETFVEIPPEDLPVEEETIEWTNPQGLTISSGLYYGDASGGIYNQYRDIRRVGCSFTQVDNVGELVLTASFPLPGETQTVPRGELFAVLQLVKPAEVMPVLEYVSDNMGVYQTFNEGPKAGCLSMKCDLYHELFQLTIRKGIIQKIRWMPAHIHEKEAGGNFVRPPGVTDLDSKANDYADDFANKASERANVSLHTAANIKYWFRLAARIQWVYVSILTCLLLGQGRAALNNVG